MLTVVWEEIHFLPSIVLGPEFILRKSQLRKIWKLMKHDVHCGKSVRDWGQGVQLDSENKVENYLA